MNFKAGDKVVCVDMGQMEEWFHIPNSEPQLGEVCCVERSETINPNHPFGYRIWLTGYGSGPVDNDTGREWGWNASRFRLVSEVQLILKAVRKNAIGKEVETHTVAQP